MNKKVQTGIDAANMLTDYLRLRTTELDAGDAANIIHFLHGIGFRAASTVSDHQSANSEPQQAVVNTLPPDAGKAEPVAWQEIAETLCAVDGNGFLQDCSPSMQNAYKIRAQAVASLYAQFPATDEAGRDTAVPSAQFKSEAE